VGEGAGLGVYVSAYKFNALFCFLIYYRTSNHSNHEAYLTMCRYDLQGQMRFIAHLRGSKDPRTVPESVWLYQLDAEKESKMPERYLKSGAIVSDMVLKESKLRFSLSLFQQISSKFLLQNLYHDGPFIHLLTRPSVVVETCSK
jgi:hypothetical protein